MKPILLIDDGKGTLGALRTLLLEQGYRLLDARDRVEATTVARGHAPGLAVVAIDSAAMDDQALQREWRSDPTLAAIPFAVLAAAPQPPGLERRVSDLGACVFVTGPATTHEMMAHLRPWLPDATATGQQALVTDAAAAGDLREYDGALIRWMETRLAELELANRELRASNEQMSQLLQLKGAGEADLKAANAELTSSRIAALNLIEDAVQAKQDLEQANRELRREMTERLRAELDIRSLHQRLGLAVRGAGYGVLEYEPETGLLVCDEGMYGIFGLTDAEVDTSCRPWLECLHPDDREQAAQRYARLASGETIESFEFRIVRASDQSTRHLEASAFLQPDDNDGPACIVGIVRDISERKRNEQQLRLLETCIGHLNDIVLITEAEPIDAPGPRIVFVNDAFEQQTGYSREEVLGLTPRLLQGPKTDRAELDRIRTSLSQWQPVRAEVLNYDKSGRELWLELMITPVADARGWFTHWVAVERDVTERKRIEQALQHSQQRLEDLISSTEGIVWEADARTLCFTFVSARAERLLGYPCERWTSEPTFWQDHIHPDDRDEALRFCRVSTAAMQAHRFQYRMLAADGREVWLDDSVSIVVEDGQPVLLRGVMIDITAIKQAQITLHDSQQRLKDLINSTDGIVWEVDIRTLEFIWVSSHAERLLGFASDRWHLDPGFWVDRLHPDDREETRRLFETCASTLQSCRRQYRMLTADGRVIWLENRVTVTADGGRLKAILGVMIDITASKQAQGALQESEERFRAVFDQSPMMIALLTLPEGMIAEMNDACLRGFGFVRDDIVGRTSVELGVWVLAEERDRYIRQMREHGSVKNMEVQMRRRNGEQFTALYNGNVVRIGNQAYSLNSIQDITELKQAQALQTALYRISEAAQTTADLVELCQRIHGILGSLLPARNFFVALHDEASDEVHFPYFIDEFDPAPPPRKFGSGGLTETVLGTGKSLLISDCDGESPARRGSINGSLPLDWLGVPLKSADRTFGVVAVQSYGGETRYDSKDQALLEFVSDLVAGAIERKRGEEALQASERRFSMMFNGNADALMLLDERRRFIDCNQAALDMLGYTSSEALRALGPADISPALQPDGRSSREAAEEMVALALRNGSHRFEWLLHRRAQADFPAEILLTPIMVEEQVLLICTIRDISEHRRAQSALLQSNADLEQFAYSVSHDMRQPLRMVSGHLQLLARSLQGRLDDTDRDNLAFALDGARRMDQMIVSLLEYSRIGRESGARTRLASRESLDEALAFLGPAIAECGSTVTVSGQWPDVVANRDEMTRLLQNLIGNANKFHDPGHAPRIAVVSDIIGPHWRVCVHDDGIGIAEDQLGRLFQFFSRLQPRTRFEGTGMGLALCRRIVEAYGGRIWAESPGEGRGSAFCFELPLAGTSGSESDASRGVPG